MLEHAWRPSFSFDPLIAEAKRRARQRRGLVAILLLVLVLGAGGATLAAHPFGWLRASRPYSGPYVPGGMFTGTGLGPPYTWPGLTAISAASRSDAWIVGSVARRWDGHEWRDVPLPRVREVDLQALATVAPDEAWAAGLYVPRTARRSHALIEHWDGTRWSVARLPSLRAAVLNDVSAAGPRSAWAVGAVYRRKPAKRYPGARPLLLHWNGAFWHRQRLPWAYPSLMLDKVVATGTTSVWVLSDQGKKSRIEYWNGTRWRLVHQPFGSNDALLGFGATAWNDAWAVGSYGLGDSRVAKYSHALAAHWNGRHWRITPVPNPPGDDNSFALVDVSAARPDDAWALGESQKLNLVGRDEADGISAPVGYSLHWDGHDWSVASGPTPSIYDGTFAISAAPDGSAWAIGNCTSDDFSLRWTGETWITAPHPRDNRWRTNGPVAAPAKSHRKSPPACTSSAAVGQ
jgi:hypothetical protein